MIRLYLAGAALAAFVALGWYALHERKEAAEARSQRDAALSQASLNQKGAEIADKGASETRVIIQQTERAADAVEQIPSDRVPDDVRSSWLRAISESGNADDPE